jgi:hypothetical protein
MDNNGDGNRVHYPKDLQYASYSMHNKSHLYLGLVA